MAKTVIVSYRGPAAPALTPQTAPGGVQAGLNRLFQKAAPGKVVWVYVEGNSLWLADGHQRRELVAIDPAIVAEHYRGIANGVIWPITHEQYEQVRSGNLVAYVQFNAIVAEQLRRIVVPGDWVTIQDYQFALVSAMVPELRTSLFWHIPWPTQVPNEFLEIMKMVARGLLGATLLGFHTKEYRRDFLKFVKQHLPEYRVYIFNVDDTVTGHSARIVVQPLGIDYSYWADLAVGPLEVPEFPTGPVVLSVERLDYSKGVLQRFNAIDRFYETNSDRRFYKTNYDRPEPVSFLQVAAKTREDVDSFQKYWDECEALEAKINARWKTDGWKPLIWIKHAIPPSKLAPLYRAADALAIGPLRDGLNLVAAEAVAAADEENPPVLCLSSGAGIWEQFGKMTWLQRGAIELKPDNPHQMATAFGKALAMPKWQRKRRIKWLKRQVKANPLTNWVDTMCLDPAKNARPRKRPNRR